MSFNFKDFKKVQDEIKLQVIDVEWYRENYEVPETKNVLEQDELITKWIQSATDQVDSICDGRLSIEIPYFDPENKQDAKELAIVQSCIGDWVEYFILTGKAFADLEKNIQSSIGYDLRASSDDGNLEAKRRDILRRLATTRFYKTISSSNGDDIAMRDVSFTNTLLDPTSSDFTALTQLLENYFLSNQGKNNMYKNLVFDATQPAHRLTTSNMILGSSDIKSGAYIFKWGEAYNPGIYGYNFYGYVDSADKADKVLFEDEYISVEELRDDKGLAFFGKDLNQALTRQEIYNLIIASKVMWRPDFTYDKGVVVYFTYEINGKTYLGEAENLIEKNKGNDPYTSPNEWRLFDTIPVDITEIVDRAVEQIEPQLDDIIDDRLDVLPTIDYKSEYANQVIPFASEDDFNKFLVESNTSASDYADVVVGGITLKVKWTKVSDNNVNLATNQTWMIPADISAAREPYKFCIRFRRTPSSGSTYDDNGSSYADYNSIDDSDYTNKVSIQMGDDVATAWISDSSIRNLTKNPNINIIRIIVYKIEVS
ncbi:MAG: hypothetical protein ACRCUM_03955 [Mycoplasmoidaceae bacterium]